MSTLMIIFLIILIGYLVGSIRVASLQLGAAGVLLVALVFGHYGMVVPALVRDIGLVCFVTSVGLLAGPVFFRNFKEKATAYLVLGFIVVTIGALVTVFTIKVCGIPSHLAAGMFSGALTSTPGLAAAIEATGDDMASVGYGIAYPFGVVGTVLFIQLIPKILKTDIAGEAAALSGKIAAATESQSAKTKDLKVLDSSGLLVFSLAVVSGLLLGALACPLLGGMRFSLGMSGGPLLTGLFLGHFARFGPYSLVVNNNTLKVLRELGLALFLVGAGTGAGSGFVEIFLQYGWLLFVLGALITLLPMLIGYFLARRILKLDLLNALGSICGGMTSTPALGTLINLTNTDAVATAYAATYPLALILMVLYCQFISLLA